MAQDQERPGTKPLPRRLADGDGEHGLGHNGTGETDDKGGTENEEEAGSHNFSLSYSGDKVN